MSAIETSTSVLERGEVLQKLNLIVKDLLNLEDTSLLSENSKLREDLSIDSLGLVDFVIALEDNFPIKFSSSFNAETITTLGDAADLILVLAKAGSHD